MIKESCPHYDPVNICDCPFQNPFLSGYVCIAMEKILDNMFEAYYDKKREATDNDRFR